MDDSNPFKRRAEEERRKRQAAADAKAAEQQAKAKAKAAAKKKAAQAPEDNWYFDGAAEDEETPPRGAAAANSDSDDDMGFRMFTSEQLPGDIARTGARLSDPGKKLNVVNLIDFSECDVPEEAQEASSSSSSLFPPMPAAAGSAAYPPQPTSAGPFNTEPSLGVGRQSLSLALPDSLGGLGSMMPGFGASRASPGGGAVTAAQQPLPPAPNEDALLAEIEHLRQRLDDAAEEKKIQVEIAHDDVADKQRALDALQRLQAEQAEALNRATHQLLALETELEAEREALQATRAEAEELRTERYCLRAAASTAASLELAEQKRREDVSVEDATELGHLRAEVLRLRQATDLRALEPPVPTSLLAELRAALAGARAVLEPGVPALVPPASEGPLEVQLRSLRDAATAVQAGAERLSVEKRQAPDGLSNREAAQALREVRQNTERQLAWIAKRIRLSAESERQAPRPGRGSVFAVA